jgi:hypothetical protein
MTMPRHTDKEIEQAARRFEQLADSLDPETAKVEDTDDLRSIATAAEAVRADDARLREAVLVARAHGRSWNHIALALGVSRQAARQRFADTDACTPTLMAHRAQKPRESFRRRLCSDREESKNQAAETGVGSTRPGLTAPKKPPSMPLANRSSYG